MPLRKITFFKECKTRGLPQNVVSFFFGNKEATEYGFQYIKGDTYSHIIIFIIRKKPRILEKTTQV